MKTLTLILLIAFTLTARPRPTSTVKVFVAPERTGWVYKTGEKAKFRVSVLKHKQPVKNCKIYYALCLEKVDTLESKSKTLKTGTGIIEGGTLKRPGFLRCHVLAKVDGKEYSGYATAGFDPHKIKATTKLPDDFLDFWKQEIKKARTLDLSPTMRPLPEQSTVAVKAYEVSFQNEKKGSRIYGILTIPTGKKRLPAVLEVPGAGIRPYFPKTENQDFIHLQIGIHGIPVTLDQKVYDALKTGALRDYKFMNLDNRDDYYFRRVYLGCLRAVDFIFTLPEFDKKRLVVFGSSQGGALSIVTAAMDRRVKHFVAFHPAMSDLTGYLHGCAGGWPHMFNKTNGKRHNKEDKIETSRYFDTVNFARQLKIPGFMTFAFNDKVTPPTTSYAVYNSIKSPKTLFLVPEGWHHRFPEQDEKAYAWVKKQLGLN